MSTIASPRDPSAPIPRRMNSSQGVSSTPPRSSLDNPSSATGSPNPNQGALPAHINTATGAGQGKRANRAALREYYNLKKTAPQPGSGTSTPTLEVTSFDSLSRTSTTDHPGPDALVPSSALDSPDFDAQAFITQTLATQGLAELLGTYARTLSEMRALDAEKKALVYDNYSKLISATETIRKMRGAMDPLQPVAATLDPAVARVYQLAAEVKESLGRGLEAERASEKETDSDERTRRRKRTQELAIEVLQMPERMRRLVEEGRAEEAEKLWERPRRLLELWREKNLGGPDVQACLEAGDAVLRREDDSLSDESPT